MARPTWKGAITFGLVNIPVTLYSGEKRIDLSFHMLDSRNHARVRYERVNEITGEEVPWDKIVKGYEYDDDNYVLLTDEDFERAAIEATKTVDIENFVDASEINPSYFEKPYILVPQKNGEKAYVLLRETLKKTGKVGIAKVVIRTRQYLAAIMPQDDAMILCILRFSNELQKLQQFDLPAESPSHYKISQREIDMAAQLVDSMTSDWEPDQYHDEYREALLKWIEKRAAAGGEAIPRAEEEAEDKPAGEIIDIMDLLKKSMKQSGRGAAKEKSTATKAKAKAKAKPKAKAKKKTASKRKAS